MYHVSDYLCMYLAVITLAGAQIDQVREYIHKCTHDVSCNCRILWIKFTYIISDECSIVMSEMYRQQEALQDFLFIHSIRVYAKTKKEASKRSFERIVRRSFHFIGSFKLQKSVAQTALMVINLINLYKRVVNMIWMQIILQWVKCGKVDCMSLWEID